MSLKNKVTFTVAGLPFTVNTDKEPESALDMADMLDNRVTELMNSARISAVQACVLASLEYQEELFETQEVLEKTKAQLKKCLEDSAKTKSERDQLKRENAKYKKNLKSSGIE